MRNPEAVADALDDHIRGLWREFSHLRRAGILRGDQREFRKMILDLCAIRRAGRTGAASVGLPYSPPVGPLSYGELERMDA